MSKVLWLENACPACATGMVLIRTITTRKDFFEGLIVRHHRHPPAADLKLQAFNPCFKCGARQLELESLLGRRTAPARRTAIVRIGNLQSIELTAENWAPRMLDYLDRCVKILGDKNPILGLSYQRMGDFFFRAGQVEPALQWHKKALAVTESTWGKEDVKYADVLLSVGLSQAALGLAAKSEPLFEASREIYQKRHPANHPLMAASHYGYGRARQAAKDHGGARKAFTQAIEILKLNADVNWATLPGDERLETPWSPLVSGFNARRVDLAEHLCHEAVLESLVAQGEWEPARPTVERIQKLLDRASNWPDKGETATDRIRKAKLVMLELEKRKR